MRLTKHFLAMLFLFYQMGALAQTTYYVTTTGTGDGSSWAKASDDLQAMINKANSGDKIFVAKGTYKPLYKADAVTGTKTLNDRNNAFVLKDGVKLYGGFNPDNGIIDLTHNRILPSSGGAGGGSILSGYFNGDDVITGSGSTLSITKNTENAYHVVISVSDTNATVLDGFTITGGNADDYYSNITVEGKDINAYSGGGMCNFHSSSPMITNTTFNGNTASFGGGMYNFNSSSPTITNTTFSGNKATNNGGGMYNFNSSSPTINNTTFNGNTASFAGGMYNESCLVLKYGYRLIIKFKLFLNIPYSVF